MSMPNPSDERPTEVPETDPIETPAEDVLAAPSTEPAAPPPPRLSYEDQLAQSPYSMSHEPSATPPPISDPTTVIPPPPLSTPVSPSPYAAAAPLPPAGLETPVAPPPPPAPSPYAPTTPPYQPGGVTPPVYTQQPYSQYQPYAQPQSASSNAIAALVCGILAWTLCGAFTGLPAAIIGFGEVKRIERGESSPAGKGMAQWGAWLGLVMCVGSVLFGLAYVLFFAAIIASAGGSP